MANTKQTKTNTDLMARWEALYETKQHKISLDRFDDRFGVFIPGMKIRRVIFDSWLRGEILDTMLRRGK